jgi:hypothetical protein
MTNIKLGISLLCIVLTTLVVAPFFVIGEVPGSGCCGGAMPVTHDSVMHYNQMQSFWRGLRAGRIYPRWDDLTHSGYGAPTTSFYPPGIYYLTSIIYLLARDWHKVLIILHWLMMAASGAAIYLYARQTMPRGASSIAMAIYLIAPYHLINQYQRGAIAEQLSFIWMPLILLFGERLWRANLSQTSNLKSQISFSGLAAVFGAFLWSHPPTAYQFTLVFGLSFCLWFLLKPGLWTRSHMRGAMRGLIAIACALIFGSMLAAIYLYPAILEKHLINAGDIEESWPYHASYVLDFTQKFYDHSVDDFIFRIDRIWIFNTAALLLTGVSLLVCRKYLVSFELRTRLWLWAGAGIIATFLMTKLSYPIGHLIPQIETGVFSWRMLSITTLVVSLLGGVCWQISPKAIGRTTAVFVILGAALMSFWYAIKPMYRAEAFKPIPEHFNYATLPGGVPRELPGMEMAQTATGAGRIQIEIWEPEYRELLVELDRPDRLEIRTSNFDGWTAFIDGRLAAIKKGAVGNIVIDLPAGKHRVTLDFRPTPIRRAAKWITALSFGLLMSILLIDRGGRKKWIKG